jgi:hypothetical protein
MFLPQNEFRSAHYANKTTLFHLLWHVFRVIGHKNTHIEKNGFLVKINTVARGI